MITVNNISSHLEVKKPTVNDGTVHRELIKVTVNKITSHEIVWEAWDGELLEGSNQFTDITGGWGATMQFTALGATEATLNSNGIVFDRFGIWQKKNTNKKINVTPYRYIDVEISCPNGLYVSNGFYFGVYRSLSDAHTDAVKLAPTTIDRRDVTRTTVTLDLYGINGDYYIAMAMLPVSPHEFMIDKINLR